jgi:hypothetical protein
MKSEKVQDGKFGAMMDVALVNDGPDIGGLRVIRQAPPDTEIEESGA